MYLKNVNTALLYLFLFVPVSVFAGQKMDNAFGVSNLVSDWVVIAVLSVFSLAGGIGSNFIKTDADEFVSHPRFAKSFIGFIVGLAIGLSLYNHYELSVYVLLIPVLISSSLGSAIFVFYMRWFSSQETQKKLGDKLRSISFLKNKDD